MSDRLFSTSKTPATGSGGMVVTNHPLGTAAGFEILAAGGTAVDAAVGALFALCVAEPMMVGIAGGGIMHLRDPEGRHHVIDALAHAPAGAHPEIYTPISDTPPDYMETKDRRSALGPSAVAAPGNLAGWCEAHRRFGRLPLADVVAPAIRIAERGFAITHYLAGAIAENAADLSLDKPIAALLMPDGEPLAPGERLVQGDFGETLKLVAKEGAAALHGGALGAALAERVATGGEDAGWLTLDDLSNYRPREREAITGDYRGYQIVGPPPPASSGVHIAEMLNIIEPHDVAGMGFGTIESLHLIAEAIRIGFEDRRAASGDPDFVDIDVEKLVSKDYARLCQARLRQHGGPVATPGAGRESANTTHVTVADGDGFVVSATHTINGLFGAKFVVPGTGIIPNNYMMNFDPHPGKALSVMPGKRVPTSMAPMMILKEGRLRWALGLPGGLRIFPSAFQAIVNLVDHHMDLQSAIEAPRIWTEGRELEIEPALRPLEAALAGRGHMVKPVPHVGGGMNAIAFAEDGSMTGAACWRADGTVAALGGGLAKADIRFWPDRTPPAER